MLEFASCFCIAYSEINSSCAFWKVKKLISRVRFRDASQNKKSGTRLLTSTVIRRIVLTWQLRKRALRMIFIQPFFHSLMIYQRGSSLRAYILKYNHQIEQWEIRSQHKINIVEYILTSHYEYLSKTYYKTSGRIPTYCIIIVKLQFLFSTSTLVLYIYIQGNFFCL